MFAKGEEDSLWITRNITYAPERAYLPSPHLLSGTTTRYKMRFSEGLTK